MKGSVALTEIYEGWNFFDFGGDPDFLALAFRLVSTEPSGCLGVSQVSFTGLEMKGTTDEVVSCPVEVHSWAPELTPATVPLPTTVAYDITLDMWLAGVSPTRGTVAGGTDVTFTLG